MSISFDARCIYCRNILNVFRPAAAGGGVRSLSSGACRGTARRMLRSRPWTRKRAATGALRRTGSWRGSCRRACRSGWRRGGSASVSRTTADQVALAVQALAVARLPLSVALRRDVGRGALLLYQFANAISIIGLIGEHDGTRAEVIEQAIGNLPFVRLPCGQAEPDREPLGVNDDVNLGREAAPAATETMI